MFRQPASNGHTEADRRRPRRSAPASPRISPARAFGLLAVVALLGGAVVALVPATGRAQSSEEFAFRIAVRLTENNEHLEFGIQRLDAEGQPRALHLGRKRFFPLNADHHRWLSGSIANLLPAPHYDAADSTAADYPHGIVGADVMVVARLHPTRGMVEFGATYELDASQLPNSIDDAFVDPVFPDRRFFPGQVDHHRWLYSSPLQFTRVWSDSLSLDPEATLDTEAPEPAPEPQPAETAEGCLAVVEQDFAAMVSEQCEDLLAAYCEEHPEHSWCARREGQG